MSQHTPGPWKVVENKRERTVQIDTERGTVVNPGGISWVPDARLIAAAPEMLEFIREIAAKGYVSLQQVQARAILRDVEGENG